MNLLAPGLKSTSGSCAKVK